MATCYKDVVVWRPVEGGPSVPHLFIETNRYVDGLWRTEVYREDGVTIHETNGYKSRVQATDHGRLWAKNYYNQTQAY